MRARWRFRLFIVARMGNSQGSAERRNFLGRMRLLSLILCLAATAQAAADSCLILKHATTSEQFWVSGANWRYIEGDFPAPMKWKSNVRDRDIRKIKELGGKVVIVPDKASLEQLEDARKQCAAKPVETKP
jgi:hypothetical protein